MRRVSDYELGEGGAAHGVVEAAVGGELEGIGEYADTNVHGGELFGVYGVGVDSADGGVETLRLCVGVLSCYVAKEWDSTFSCSGRYEGGGQEKSEGHVG